MNDFPDYKDCAPHKWDEAVQLPDGTFTVQQCLVCGVSVEEHVRYVRLILLNVPGEYTGNNYKGKW